MSLPDIRPRLERTLSSLTEYVRANRFAVASWGATAVLVVSLLGFAVLKNGSSGEASRPEPTALPGHEPSVGLPVAPVVSSGVAALGRQLQLKTNIPADRHDSQPTTYRVLRGDALFSIAKQFDLKPETILFANQDTLYDNPGNLQPGMELVVPPVDGVYYKWEEGDTIESVAKKFKADLNGDKSIDDKDVEILSDAIVNFPGNGIDLTDPQIAPDTLVMVPGGQRELVAWLEFVPTTDRTGSTTATSELGGSGCSGGPIGVPGIWPTNGPHTLSGNDYSPKHLGIDITASTSTAVLASGDGVVVFAGFSSYGYGNVVQIDHGNGFATIYAHLSQLNVSQCEAVYGGQVIGMAGSTGNSTGVHLHFEVRKGGVNLNPWSIVQ